MRETSANEPLRTHRNFSDDIETGECPCPGKSMAETYVLAMRCPVYRRRESHPGFRTELENLAGDDKGKGASGSSARPKLPMRQSGADCPVVPMRRRNVRGGKGVGHPRRDRLVNWQQEEPVGLGRRRQPSGGGTSRMSREAQVRICERLGVQLPGPTRRPGPRGYPPRAANTAAWDSLVCPRFAAYSWQAL